MSHRLYDAHNHLQDARLGADRDAIVSAAARVGVVRMVVNGSCEEDWSAVLELARRYPCALPSFGYHPWYVRERTPHWRAELERFLDATPSALGEIGLDRWIENPDLAAQEETFVWQLRLAAERDLPASIHCLKAWGWLHELLCANPRPARGFLLHSYGGPREMIEPLARLGAYFSFSGYFAHVRKERQREVFKHVPPDRLLIETDAPNQSLPVELNRHPMSDPATGNPVNHPANLAVVYEFTAGLLGEPMEQLALRVEENFARLFGAR